MPAIPVVVRLICVVSYLEEDIPQISQLLSEINDETLLHVQHILEAKQRFDVLAIVRQTMTGDYTLLEEQERQMEGTLNDFYNDHDARMRSPAWCWCMTQNYNPVRQETVSRRTESGVENNLKYGNVEIRPRQHNMPHPSEHRNAGRTGPQVDQKISSFQRPFQFPSTEPVFLQPLRPLDNPPPSQCCLCGKDIKATQTSRSVWSRICNMIIGLNPESLQRFVTEIERYNSNIFNFIQGHTYSSQEVIDDVLPRLQRFYPDGRKCLLCLINYLFQRSGLSDLANQVNRLYPDRL